jgi:N6-adenosine-specific RNA methylase IME4
MSRYRSLGEIDRRYNTVVIDPPWPISNNGGWEGQHAKPLKIPYNTMDLIEIAAMDIKKVCNIGAHVYLWTTNRFLNNAIKILEGWGIKYHLTITMVKPSGMCPSLGYVFASEYCLMGYAGSPMVPFIKAGELNWFKNASKAGEHSKKPHVFYKMVEATSPGPRIDLFARSLRAGWDLMGDELDFAQVELC